MGMERGDADFSMDGWIGNLLEVWEKVTGNGKMVSLGANFPDAPQGWYVPTYMIRGDKKRGIRPVAPDLKSVADLPGYKELFWDAADPGSGPICLHIHPLPVLFKKIPGPAVLAALPYFFEGYFVNFLRTST